MASVQLESVQRNRVGSDSEVPGPSSGSGFTIGVIVGKALNLSEPQFLPLQNGGYRSHLPGSVCTRGLMAGQGAGGNTAGLQRRPRNSRVAVHPSEVGAGAEGRRRHSASQRFTK